MKQQSCIAGEFSPRIRKEKRLKSTPKYKDNPKSEISTPVRKKETRPPKAQNSLFQSEKSPVPKLEGKMTRVIIGEPLFLRQDKLYQQRLIMLISERN